MRACLLEPLTLGALRITGPESSGNTPLRYRPYFSRTREIRLVATLPLETIRDRTQEMNSTGSLSHPQAAWVGDAVASDDEDSVWVFPECKYNDITLKSTEFVPRRLCPHKKASSKIKTLSVFQTATNIDRSCIKHST